MNKDHLREIELARVSDGEASEEIAGHVDCCSSCRWRLSDYEWLQREITAVFDTEAAVAAVPRPDWQVVRERVGSSSEKGSERPVLITVGVALIACVILAAPSILGRKVEAQTKGEWNVSTARRPVTAMGVETTGTRCLTMTPSERDGEVSLPFVPPPTPPEPGA